MENTKDKGDVNEWFDTLAQNNGMRIRLNVFNKEEVQLLIQEIEYFTGNKYYMTHEAQSRVFAYTCDYRCSFKYYKKTETEEQVTGR